MHHISVFIQSFDPVYNNNVIALTSGCSGSGTALSNVRRLFKEKPKTVARDNYRTCFGTISRDLSSYFSCRKCFIQEVIKMFHNINNGSRKSSAGQNINIVASKCFEKGFILHL